MRTRWVAVAIAVVLVVMAVPVIAAESADDLASVITRLTGLEKRVEQLEAEGFARVNKAGKIGSATFKAEGITLEILSVTAGPHGTIVAARVKNDSDKALGFYEGQFVLVAGTKQLENPGYRLDFSLDTIQPKASLDFVMTFDPLPAGTKTVRFVPKLYVKDTYKDVKVSVEGKI